MLDLATLVHNLKRPGLLVRAARFGLDEYRRDTMLKRLLKTDQLPHTGPALMRLLELERAANDARLEKSAEYSVTRHIQLLTAIMGEARLLEANARYLTIVT